MGNTPGKLETGNVDGDYENESYRTRPRHSSLANSILNTNGGGCGGDGYANANSRQRAHSMFNKMDREREKRKSSKEREQAKETFARGLLVKYDESCDGGFLAPFGCYGFDKLDYNIVIVKRLIVERKMAPFYTPLQDFDDSWSKEEIIKIVDGLPLHATFEECPEEYEDVPIGDLETANFDYLIDRTLSKKEQRRLHSKIFKARLYRRRLNWQENANEQFLEAKLELKSHGGGGNVNNINLPTDDLKYLIYKDGVECPICFLYVPGPLNYSRCCQQPICSECFVQIKRSAPHFPHEEVDPRRGFCNDRDPDPNLLISEPSNCPYCATPNFAITYSPPRNRRTGIGGVSPGNFIRQEEGSVEESVEGSVEESVVTSDDIRPDWQVRLKKERSRLAKRSANATAIHVSNQLIDPDHSTRQNSDSLLDEEMLQQAIRLSLGDSVVNK